MKCVNDEEKNQKKSAVQKNVISEKRNLGMQNNRQKIEADKTDGG